MELKDLQKKTVNELRELAHKYEDLKGVSGMKKEALVEILCDKMGIDRHHHLPTGIGRRAMKARIRGLKSRRDQALEAHDAKALKRLRARIRRTKHRLRMVITRAERAQAAAKKKEEAPTA